MNDDRKFDLQCFLTPTDMRDLDRNGKNAKCLKRLEKYLCEEDFDKLMTDFVTKLAYEIHPVLQIKKNWLAKIFGFAGELRVNVDTQNGDAIYIDPTGTQIIKIELKHFSMAEVRRNSQGEAERQTMYSPDRDRYFKINNKSWKFRTTTILDDAVLLMMVDSRTDKLVETIAIKRDQIQPLMVECRTTAYDGGTNPCKISYRHVKDYPHMAGNKAMNVPKLLTDWLVEQGHVTRQSKRYYATGLIGSTHTDVYNWAVGERGYRKQFLAATGVRI